MEKTDRLYLFNFTYYKRAGYDHEMKFPFGELVFVKSVEE
jgi:hypothetical protein